MGSLTSDLLTLHNDSYVVRVQVQVDGVILATGLATAPSIEAAEDQARIRALQTLVLEQDVSANATLPMSIGEPITDKAITAASGLIAPTRIDKPDPDMFPAINAAVGESTVHLESEPREARLPSSELAKSKLSQPPLPHLPQGPVDLSDIIAQTDVELRRLGWTSAQGREYLEQTYGKRSRQQLSDEELLTFLLYLESQTSQ